MASLIKGVTTTGVGPHINTGAAKRTYQGVAEGTGEVSASVDIEVSNNGVDFLLLGTLDLSGTTRATDGFVSDAPWLYARANVTSISGTGTTISVETEA